MQIVAELTADQGEIVLLAGGLDVYANASAAKALQTLTPLFRQTDPPGALRVPTSWPAVVQLSALFGPSGAWAPGPRLQDWVAEEIRRRTTPITPEQHAEVHALVPAGLEARPYQVEGALEIARTGRCLIFDEPRTGKTITTILGLSLLTQRWLDDTTVRKPLPILVVCPASVVDPWVEAFERWAPHLGAVAWRGAKRRQLLEVERIDRAHVFVTSYDTARIDAAEMSTSRGKAPLLALAAQSLVVDESHYVKNATAARTRAVKRLGRTAKAAVVGLSGTPITHHPADLWPMLATLHEGSWPARERWVARYCQVVPGEDYTETILGLHPWTEGEFRLAITGQHRRVARADVMSQLPPKVYSVRTVELPAAWRKVYDDFEAQMLAELPDGSELSVMDTLSVLTHLSSLASAAADVRIEYGPDLDDLGQPKRHVHLDLKAPSWKVDALLEILDERPGEQVVCFDPSAQIVKLAGAAAAAKGYRVGYVVGGQAAGARTQAIRDFQEGRLDLICATTGAGGTGITLSAAGTLVFLKRPWSLVESLQAEDRAEGDLTATRGTEVIDVVARNTVDTRVRAVLRARAGQLADLVQDPRIVAELLGGSRVTHHDTEERAAS